MSSRQNNLRRNFSLMFLIQALTSVQVIGTISTIFMVHRGLTLSQVFYTAIIFSIVSFLFEVPSSYLADRWGRKKVIILSCVLYLAYWIATIFAHSFPLFMFAIGLYACSNALLSGTDEALIYDTSQELGQSDHSLKQLGVYFSSQRIFKIIVPIIAVFIAKDLSETQFISVLLIDVAAAMIAIITSLFLTEPTHVFSREKAESGILRDTLRLFHHNHFLLTIMLNRTLLFITTFLIWRVSSEFFHQVGIPLLVIGITFSLFQSLGFFASWNIDKLFPQIPTTERLNFLNTLCCLAICTFFINSVTIKNTWVFLFSYIFTAGLEIIRWPLFSQLINGVSNSYNRATVLSMSNILKSILDIPLLFLSALLVSLNYPALFGLTALVALISTFVFYLPQQKNPKLNVS